MKKIYWVFCSLLAACTTAVQKDKPISPEQQIAIWDSGMQYRVDTLPIDTNDAEMPDGGMETTFYSLNGKLMKVREEVGLSWGRLISVFYCIGDTLRGFSENQESFPFIGDSLDHGHLRQAYKGLLIFKADTVANVSFKGEKMFADSSQNFGAQILEEFRDHLAEYKELKSNK